MNKIYSGAHALTMLRYPALTAADVRVNRRPTGGPGETSLYPVRLAPEDVAALRNLANELLKQHAGDLSGPGSYVLGLAPVGEAPPEFKP